MKAVYQRSPAFSLAGREPWDLKDHNVEDPSPADYFPELGAVGPEKSIAGKLSQPKKDNVPLCEYNLSPAANFVQVSSPKYSIRKRLDLPDRIRTPGPDKYTPDKTSVMSAAPRYTFGIRHKSFTKDENPAPNEFGADFKKYIEPSKCAVMLGKPRELLKNPTPGPTEVNFSSVERSPPRFSIKSRQRELKGTNYITPSPLTYNISEPAKKTKSKAPAYTMQGRQEMRDRQADLPGPEYHYDYSKVKQKAPQYSFAGPKKRFERRSKGNPAPNEYMLEKSMRVVKRASPQYSMGSRTKLVGREKVPGPAQYDPAISIKFTQQKEPKFSMRRKHKDYSGMNMNPGPKYKIPSAFESHKSGFSFGIRHKDIQKERSQGPAAYLPKAKKKGLSYSMRPKHNYKARSFTPGPAAYSLGSMFGND